MCTLVGWTIIHLGCILALFENIILYNLRIDIFTTTDVLCFMGIHRGQSQPQILEIINYLKNCSDTGRGRQTPENAHEHCLIRPT